MENKVIVAILGSGLIGKSWAMLFASGGHEVRLYDTDPVVVKALTDIRNKLEKLEEDGTLKNSKVLSSKMQSELISSYSTLETTPSGTPRISTMYSGTPGRQVFSLR